MPLSFLPMAAEAVRQPCRIPDVRLLPDRDARILIYCNNNFLNAPGPFPSKLPSASLNLSTYITLYDYGYRNLYELGPSVDLRASRLEFEPAVDPSLSDGFESATMRSP
jgi:hypothetical protein